MKNRHHRDNFPAATAVCKNVLPATLFLAPRQFCKVSGNRNFGSHSNSDDGAAAIEFAFVAPVMILLVMGMIAYGIFFGAAHSVQQIAADAARVSIAGIDEAERKQLVGNFISHNSSGYVFINPKMLAFTVGGAPHDASQLLVSVSYDATSLPIWGLLSSSLLPEKRITRQVSIRVGGV